MTKSTKSHQRECSSLFENSSRVHELVARAMRGKCVQHWAKQKLAVLLLSAISYYHACEHITRKSRADSCTHCLHARYKCRAGVNLICALTEWSVYTLVWCKLLFLRIKKSRQEIRGFPALYFRLYNFSTPYTKVSFAYFSFQRKVRSKKSTVEEK